MGAIAGIIGGDLAMVNGETRVKNWQIGSKSRNLQEVYDSSTGGAPVVLDGNDDWSGSFQCNGATPSVMPGEEFTFTGTIDGTNGATGTARVSSVELTVDRSTQGVIGFTVNFERNGALTLGAAAVSDDVTTSAPPSGADASLWVTDDNVTWTEVSNFRTATLSISADLQAYADSSTEGGIERLDGNKSARLSFQVHCDTFADLPSFGTYRGYRIYVTATTFWQILWILQGELSGLEVSRENPEQPVGATVNGTWSIYDDADVQGHILQPGGTQWWPEGS